MARVQLSDGETAVTYDSLVMTRDLLQEGGQDTPNIDSAKKKLGSLLTPNTYGVTILADETEAWVVGVGFSASGIQNVEPTVYFSREEAQVRIDQISLQDDAYWGLLVPITIKESR